jgi:hypothetical protein
MKFGNLRLLFIVVLILINLMCKNVLSKSKVSYKSRKFYKNYQNKLNSNQIDTYSTDYNSNLNYSKVKLYCIWSDFLINKIDESSLNWKSNSEDENSNENNFDNKIIDNYSFEINFLTDKIIIKNLEGIVVKKIYYNNVLLKYDEIGFETGVLNSSFGLNCLTFSYFNMSKYNFSKTSSNNNVKFINICPFVSQNYQILKPILPNDRQVIFLKDSITAGRKSSENNIFEYFDYEGNEKLLDYYRKKSTKYNIKYKNKSNKIENCKLNVNVDNSSLSKNQNQNSLQLENNNLNLTSEFTDKYNLNIEGNSLNNRYKSNKSLFLSKKHSQLAKAFSDFDKTGISESKKFIIKLYII